MLRRDFLRAAGSLAALGLPDRLLADPYGWADRSGGLPHQRGWLAPRRTWVEPTPTAHMFYVAASAGAGDVRVEATDRWGRVYTAAPEAV